MRLTPRLTVAALLLVAGPAPAQPPEAPPPHTPLAAVAAEYRRLGLPIPPPDAEFVRIRKWDEEEEPYIVGFRLPPRTPGDDPTYMIGDGSIWHDAWIDPARAEVVDRTRPAADALHRAGMTDDQFLCLAAQCKLRGWDAVADAAYAKARALLEDPPLLTLRYAAQGRLFRELGTPGTDRTATLRRLKQLASEEPALRTREHDRLIRQLQLTVAPRASKPGSVEALIDDLTEYKELSGPFIHENPDPASLALYWRLAERGFDAVPALIDHLADDRLTRGTWVGLQPYIGGHLTVGHVCSRLLYDLSGRTISGGYWEARGDRLDPDHARKWFAGVQKVGEERWLLDHAVPADGGKVITNQRGRPERLIVRVIAVKYPDRLPAIYRAVLGKPAAPLIGDFVDEIVASRLTRERKAALLLEGAAHADLGHRLPALGGLAEVEPPAFRKHLLRTLEKIRADAAAGKGPVDWFALVQLVEKAGDRASWDALAVVAAAVSPGSRAEMIHHVGPQPGHGRTDPNRRERLRFLVRFLDDRSVDVDEDGTRTEIRDFAADRLAFLCGFRVHHDPEFPPPFEPERRPLAGFVLRAIVRQAAERELAGPKK